VTDELLCVQDVVEEAMLHPPPDQPEWVSTDLVPVRMRF